MIEKISSKEADIEKNEWLLRDVIIFKPQNGVLTKIELESYKISSIYNHEKINSLFKNFDTMSFIELIVNYNKLLNNGYNKSF